MFVIHCLAVFALGPISLGLKGLSSAGLPVTGKRRLTGRPAHIVGWLCIAFGAAVLVAYLCLLVVLFRLK